MHPVAIFLLIGLFVIGIPVTIVIIINNNKSRRERAEWRQRNKEWQDKRAEAEKTEFAGYTLERYFKGWFIKNPAGEFLRQRKMDRKYYWSHLEEESPNEVNEIVFEHDTADLINRLRDSIADVRIRNEKEPQEIIKL